MKQFIFLMACMIVMIPTIIYLSDQGATEYTMLIAKRDSSEAAKSVANMIEPEAYGEGTIQIKDSNVLEYLKNEIGDNYTYEINIYDNTNRLRTYKASNIDEKATLVSQKEDYVPAGEIRQAKDSKGEDFSVTNGIPTVQITLHRNVDSYRIIGLDGNDDITRASQVSVVPRGV